MNSLTILSLGFTFYLDPIFISSIYSHCSKKLHTFEINLSLNPDDQFKYFEAMIESMKPLLINRTFPLYFLVNSEVSIVTALKIKNIIENDE